MFFWIFPCDLKLLGRQFVTVGRRQPTKIIEDHCTENFISASQMVRKVAALSNLVCRILIHPTSLLSYVIGLASLLLASRVPRTKNFLDPSFRRISASMENTGKVLLTSMHGLVGQQYLISHSESGNSGRLLWSSRNKDQSRELLKSACLSNKGTQFQTKGGISDGALKVNILRYPGICFLLLHFSRCGPY